MFAQVHCFVLVVLVAGALCAPSPDRYRIGGSHGTSGQTAVNIGGGGKGALSGKRLDGSASGKFGLSGSGDVDGSVYVQKDDTIVEAAGDYHASGGGWVKPSVGFHGGKNDDGKYDIGANGKALSYGEHSGAGGAGINTDQDALRKYNEHKNRSAFDIIREMDDDDN